MSLDEQLTTLREHCGGEPNDLYLAAWGAARAIISSPTGDSEKVTELRALVDAVDIVRVEISPEAGQ